MRLFIGLLGSQWLGSGKCLDSFALIDLSLYVDKRFLLSFSMSMNRFTLCFSLFKYHITMESLIMFFSKSSYVVSKINFSLEL